MTGRSKYNLLALTVLVLLIELITGGLLLTGYYLAKFYLKGVAFHHPEYVWLLLLPTAMSLAYLLSIQIRNRKLQKWADFALIPLVFPAISSLRSVLRFALLRLAILSLIVALIDPKVGTKLEEVKSTGIDIMIALDVSNSMLAEDLKPKRLIKSKQAIRQLIQQLGGDRIGIIIFAGQAYVQLPLTADYDAAQLFLDGVDTDMISVQGTAIGSALSLAISSFGDSENSKAIVVITDGENHEDDAIAQAESAADLGIVVHAIGMGTIEGAPIPILNAKGQQVGFKEDKSGNPVVSGLNEEMLRQLVTAGKGVYVRASNSYSGLSDIVADMRKMEQKELGSFRFSEYEHRFQYFLALAIACLLIQMTISERRKNWSRNLNIFDAK